MGGAGHVLCDDDAEEVDVEGYDWLLAEDGEGERDWTISWTRERGCWPRPSKGGRLAERVVTRARDGVARSRITFSLKR